MEKEKKISEIYKSKSKLFIKILLMLFNVKMINNFYIYYKYYILQLLTLINYSKFKQIKF